MSKFDELLMIVNDFKSESTVVGLLDDSNIYLEGEVDRSNYDGMKLIMDIRTKEGGNIPHFHLYVKGARNTRNGKNKKTFHTCIMLEKAEYFKHGFKDGELTSSQKKILQEVLEKESDTHIGYKLRLWDKMCIIWNATSDNNIKVSLDAEMPDYTKL